MANQPSGKNGKTHDFYKTNRKPKLFLATGSLTRVALVMGFEPTYSTAILPSFSITCDITELHENVLAGMIGVEPMNHGVKDRCLNHLATSQCMRLSIFQPRRCWKIKEYEQNSNKPIKSFENHRLLIGVLFTTLIL